MRGMQKSTKIIIACVVAVCIIVPAIVLPIVLLGGNHTYRFSAARIMSRSNLATSGAWRTSELNPEVLANPATRGGAVDGIFNEHVRPLFGPIITAIAEQGIEITVNLEGEPTPFPLGDLVVPLANFVVNPTPADLLLVANPDEGARAELIIRQLLTQAINSLNRPNQFRNFVVQAVEARRGDSLAVDTANTIELVAEVWEDMWEFTLEVLASELLMYYEERNDIFFLVQILQIEAVGSTRTGEWVYVGPTNNIALGWERNSPEYNAILEAQAEEMLRMINMILNQPIGTDLSVFGLLELMGPMFALNLNEIFEMVDWILDLATGLTIELDGSNSGNFLLGGDAIDFLLEMIEDAGLDIFISEMIYMLLTLVQFEIAETGSGGIYNMQVFFEDELTGSRMGIADLIDMALSMPGILPEYIIDLMRPANPTADPDLTINVRFQYNRNNNRISVVVDLGLGSFPIWEAGFDGLTSNPAPGQSGHQSGVPVGAPINYVFMLPINLDVQLALDFARG